MYLHENKENFQEMIELVSTDMWGCFDTVRGLRIAELLRPQNSKVVSVIRYTWNGRERILDEQ